MKTMIAKYILIPLAAISIAATASAGVERVTVEVDGLACPFCAFNLEKRILTLEGVPEESDWKVSLEEGTAAFDWNPEVAFDEEAVREQVRRAGFTPGGIDTVEGPGTGEKPEDEETAMISAEGGVRLVEREESEELFLTKADTTETVRVLPAEREDFKRSHRSLRDYARNHTGADGEPRVQLEGTLSEEDAGVLLVERWNPSRFGSEVIVRVEDTACEHCSVAIMDSLLDHEDVLHVHSDHESGHVHVWTRSSDPDLKVIHDAVEDAGFAVSGD